MSPWENFQPAGLETRALNNLYHHLLDDQEDPEKEGLLTFFVPGELDHTERLSAKVRKEHEEATRREKAANKKKAKKGSTVKAPGPTIDFALGGGKITSPPGSCPTTPVSSPRSPLHSPAPAILPSSSTPPSTGGEEGGAKVIFGKKKSKKRKTPDGKDGEGSNGDAVDGEPAPKKKRRGGKNTRLAANHVESVKDGETEKGKPPKLPKLTGGAGNVGNTSKKWKADEAAEGSGSKAKKATLTVEGPVPTRRMMRSSGETPLASQLDPDDELGRVVKDWWYTIVRRLCRIFFRCSPLLLLALATTGAAGLPEGDFDIRRIPEIGLATAERACSRTRPG
ncbi:hypothetical protein B0H17DRAFT_1217953 [Mycena rosella]|uniref:Uncharacterized protein n=1 Tax=Mycena rosella TaxID=1033263 RepID=A0AAD7BST8_MYCRO|nr:hypothetical protein B0H17DRAFT_1217953 [Mycena rosella]